MKSIKKLEKFESSSLKRDELYHTQGGMLPSDGGGTGSTYSVCHIDGKTDGDGTGSTYSICHIDGVTDGD
jgi:hypothetical protein